MRHFFVIGICLAYLLCGCAVNPVKTSFGLKADLDDILRFRRNMTPDEIIGLMGRPSRPILIYFYMTEEDGSLFSRFSKGNYTPFVFVDNKLAGWGWEYLNGAAEEMTNN